MSHHGRRHRTEGASKFSTNMEANVANEASVTELNETSVSSDTLLEVLAEMKEMRKDLSERFDKVEESLKGVNEQIRGCEKRLDEAEQRVSNIEDHGTRADRLLAYTIRKQRRLEAHCEDIENRARRSNLRIYGVKEGTEGEGNMLEFTAKLLKTALKLPEAEDLGIERAHRSLATKPTNPNISRSIVVKFLHFQTKQRILYAGWNAKGLQFEGNRITFDHDYSTALQRRRKEYGEIKRQLKERKIKFRSSYPAVLRVSLENGEKTFNSAWEAAEQLKHLGITVRLSEAELMEKELHQRGWTSQFRPGGEQLTRALVKDMEALGN